MQEMLEDIITAGYCVQLDRWSSGIYRCLLLNDHGEPFDVFQDTKGLLGAVTKAWECVTK